MGAAVVLATWIPLGFADEARAATYYVTVDGDDSNSCAEAEDEGGAKRSLMGPSGGISCLGAGDTLLVGAGNYDERITNASLYTADSPSWPSGTSWDDAIRVASMPGETATIDGLRFGDCCENTALPQLSYWIFEGFEIEDGEIYLANHIDHLRLVGNDVHGQVGASAVGVGGATAESIEIVGNKFHDIASDCVPGNRYYGIYLNKASNTLIDGNEFYGLPGGGIHMYNAGNLPRASGTVIRNNSIHDNSWCDTSNIGGMWIGDADDTLVYNNLVYDNGIDGRGAGIAFGISSNTRVFNNTIYRNQARGLHSGGSNAPGLVIQNNIVWDNGNSVYFEDPADVTFDHNLCESDCDIGGDPQFVDADNGDFRPGSDASPAIDQGLNLHAEGVIVDFDGQPRPRAGAFELGAHEYCPDGCGSAGQDESGGASGTESTGASGDGAAGTSSGTSGVGESSGAATTTQSSAGGAGTSTGGDGAGLDPVEQQGGCSCAATRASTNPLAWLAVWALVPVGLRRRRTR